MTLNPALESPWIRETFSYKSLSAPAPEPPYRGLVPAQPKTLMAEFFFRGSDPSSFFSRTVPSPAMDSVSLLDCAVVAALMMPRPPVDNVSNVLIGPKQMRLATTVIAANATTKDSLRISPRNGLPTFMHAMLATTANATMTPSAMRYVLHEARTLVTSLMLSLIILKLLRSFYGYDADGIHAT